MTSGSPSSVARLQKSITERTAWLSAAMDTRLLVRRASFLSRMSNCRAGGVDLADVQEIEFEFVCTGQCIEQELLLIKRAW